MLSGSAISKSAGWNRQSSLQSAMHRLFSCGRWPKREGSASEALTHGLDLYIQLNISYLQNDFDLNDSPPVGILYNCHVFEHPAPGEACFQNANQQIGRA